MYLSDANDAFRAAEITTENTDAASQGSRADFRAGEIVAQNTAAATPASKLPRLLMAGAGIFLLYNFLWKGMKR